MVISRVVVSTLLHKDILALLIIKLTTTVLTDCADPYAANEFGTCVLNMNCGPFQYWHFGSCHDVITNCKNFDKIGGLCSECVKGYKIVNYNDGSQSCEK